MSKKKRKDDDFFDDGRVIADMNVEGVRRNVFGMDGIRGFGSSVEKKDLPRREDGEAPWTFRERLSLYAGAMAAVIIFTVIVFGGIALFMYFWLR